MWSTSTHSPSPFLVGGGGGAGGHKNRVIRREAGGPGGERIYACNVVYIYLPNARSLHDFIGDVFPVT